MNTWKTLNSPFVITLLILASAFVLIQARKNVVASEIRAVYDELMAILEESSDENRQMVVRDFVQELSGEVIGGFKDAFETGSDEKKDQLERMIETRERITTTNPRKAGQSWSDREAYVFELTNDSENPVSDITLNYSFLLGGVLIDAETEEIRDIDILMPGESVSLKAERSFDDEADDPNTSEKMTISVLSVRTKEI